MSCDCAAPHAQRLTVGSAHDKGLLVGGRGLISRGRQQYMRVVAHAGFLALLPILLGCATSTVGQVREVAPGTYKIGVARGANSVVIGNEATNAAVSQAGQYCHSKGQKLVIVPDAGRDVVFRCGEKTQDSVAPSTSN
jgi:hypothetical protein